MNNPPIPAYKPLIEEPISIGMKKLEEWNERAVDFALRNSYSSPAKKIVFPAMQALAQAIEHNSVTVLWAAIPALKTHITEGLLYAHSPDDFQSIKLLAEAYQYIHMLPQPSWFDELEESEFGRAGN